MEYWSHPFLPFLFCSICFCVVFLGKKKKEKKSFISFSSRDKMRRFPGPGQNILRRSERTSFSNVILMGPPGCGEFVFFFF